MSERLIIVTAQPAYEDTIAAMAEQAEVLSYSAYPLTGHDSGKAFHLLVSADHRQTMLDNLQSLLGKSDDWRIIVLPIEATIPFAPPQNEVASENRPGSGGESREELYNDIAKSAEQNRNFFLFVSLSTVVAAIGLVKDNVAVVIGAMVIAPLLGPNLAYALGVALGDWALIRRALCTSASGVTLTLVMCIAVGLLLPPDLQSKELLVRTVVGFDGAALALASGAAAALSLTTGLSSALVGVMVAVALLPPAATMGLMIGSSHWSLALGAALLLAVNVVCLNISAHLTFILTGLTPRTWSEKKEARRTTFLHLAGSLLLFLLLVAVLLARGHTR